MIRIAVIGGGPKSLFALLALNDRLPSTASRQVTVEVYDPLPPGAGSVWRVDQPEVLRLNVDAGIVNASSKLSADSFAAWVDREASERSGEKYPPRRLVGRYLCEQFRLLSQYGNFTVAHAPLVVTGVERDGELWCVSGPFGEQHYEEVLLATGHGLAQTSSVEAPPCALNSHALIGDYSELATSNVPSGSEVWIRGAALTAYDVALLLSEGRGGSWLQATNNVGSQQELRYCPSGDEPGRITLFSRSGSLMDPKTETIPDVVAVCVDDHRQRLRQWGKEVQGTRPPLEVSLDGLWAILLHCAQDCAGVMGVTVSALGLWRTALTGQSVEAGGPPTNIPKAPSATAHMRHSLAVNHLQAPITTGWLWARAWSGLYAELVSAMDRLPRSIRTSRQFGRVAHNLEKFAFGPPELTARKLVALFDAGILYVAEAEENPPPGSILIDAVTPGPGALRAPAPTGSPNSGLFAKLLDTRYVSIRPGDRGLLTDPDGTCLAHDGSRSESLAALGRPTEDPTLGHDTLNRSLHGEHCLWARRIAGLVADQLDS
ncbi:MAG: FAD/NAD(P)-binding protein [Specibacter sp.]